MTENEIKTYLKSLIKKYDYYDPIKDRTEALKFAKIKGETVLDVGTGRGYIALLAAKLFKCNVTTVDLSEEKIRLAKSNAENENVADNIKFMRADAAKLPFEGNSFDSVISFNALHHSDGKFNKIIQEMFRVSKRKVVITELNKTGAKLFDEYIHPEENHRAMILDLDELKRYLSKYSKVKILERKLMTTYVCNKNGGKIKNE